MYAYIKSIYIGRQKTVAYVREIIIYCKLNLVCYVLLPLVVTLGVDHKGRSQRGRGANICRGEVKNLADVRKLVFLVSLFQYVCRHPLCLSINSERLHFFKLLKS